MLKKILSKSLTVLFLFVYLYTDKSFSKVVPPNYGFTLEDLQDFSPGKNFSEIEKKWGKAEFYLKNKKLKIYKIHLIKKSFRFPLYLQVFDEKIIEFYAKLPSYFSHDLFLKELIKTHGKQNEYFKQNNLAIYEWKKEDNLKLIYSGSCTITCFPIYYQVSWTKIPEGPEKYDNILSILNQGR